MIIIEMGVAEGLVKMLGSAKDDRTKNEALKALAALSASDDAVAALYHAGVISAIRSIPDSRDNVEAMQYKSNLLKRFHFSRPQSIFFSVANSYPFQSIFFFNVKLHLQ